MAGERSEAERSELLTAIHDAHGPALMRYVLRLTGDYPFAQDVVQEAMLRAWKKPAILEQDEDSVRAWLFTVSRNLVIDDRRSARHAREFATDDLPESPTADRTDVVLDRWVLADVLASLSIEHRTAVVSAYYLGDTVAEIARREDLPEGTVKSRLHYGLKALRNSLQERGMIE